MSWSRPSRGSGVTCRPKGRGIPVAITYVITGVTAFVVIGAAIVAVVNAAVAFVDALPTLIPKIGDALEPLFDLLGITMPSGGSVVGVPPDVPRGERGGADRGAQVGRPAAA